MEDSMRDLMTSATSQPKNRESINLGNLLNTLAKSDSSAKKSPSFPAPPPPLFHAPPSSLMMVGEGAAKAETKECNGLVQLHIPISNFKTVSERKTPGQLVSANRTYIAYVVGGKKVRVIEQDTGSKGLMENLKDSRGAIVSVGIKDNVLATLTDSGELMVSNIYKQSNTLLACEPVVSLTFPDLQPSHLATWSSGQEPVLAVHGDSPAVFIVWLNPKPLAVELPHSIPDKIESVCFFGSGNFVAVASQTMVECFEIYQDNKTQFTKVSQVSFGEGIQCDRVQLFEDNGKDCDFTIGAAASGKFIACPVKIGRPLAWIETDVPFTPRTAIAYDALMQAFVIDDRAGNFTVLGFRSDSLGFAGVKGTWKEPQTVYSMQICPELRNLDADVHIPVFIYQPEYVSMYGLRLPKPEQPSPKIVNVQTSPKPTVLGSSKTDVDLNQLVKSILLERLVPAVEASINEMLNQVKAQLLSNHLSLESKVDRLSESVSQLKTAIETLASSNQTVGSSTSGETPLVEPVTSADDLFKAEIEEILEKDSPVAALIRCLEVGNLTILSWLLSRLDAVSTVESVPEPVKLSLAQQLGVDLASNTELKLDWLAEIFTTLKADGMDASLVGEVVEELFSNLRILFAELPSESGLIRKVKMVMRLLRAYM